MHPSRVRSPVRGIIFVASRCIESAAPEGRHHQEYAALTELVNSIWLRIYKYVAQVTMSGVTGLFRYLAVSMNFQLTPLA
jgi:hypothetical protein